MNIEDEVDNMIYIHLGDGLGGAIVANKNIFHGDRGYAGEIGKMVYCMKPLTTVGDVYENIRCNMNQFCTLISHLLNNLRIFIR